MTLRYKYLYSHAADDAQARGGGAAAERLHTSCRHVDMHLQRLRLCAALQAALHAALYTRVRAAAHSI
jgi:hypothetical protein